jgi:hypothetical protein
VSQQQRQRRSAAAWKLPGAAHFSTDAVLDDPLAIVRAINAIEEVHDPLIEQTTPPYAGWGRRRQPGSWALIYIAFVMSKIIDFQPFYSRYRSSPLWAEAGFDDVPSYDTLYLRFCELEGDEFRAAFNEAAARLMRLAMERDPRIGRAAHADGTAYQSNAQLVHCCPDPNRCRQIGGWRPAKVVAKENMERITEAHHAETALPESEVPAEPSNRMRRLTDEEAAEHGLEAPHRYAYYLQNGHYVRCRDKDAAVRMYERSRSKRVWNGGIFYPAVDDYCGLTMAIHAMRADINENTAYPDLYERLVANTGRAPIAIVSDGALAFRSIYEFNTERGVGSIFRDRKLGPTRTYADLRCDKFDEDGVPGCQHCGGEGTTHEENAAGVEHPASGLGFVLTESGEPIIRFRCKHRHLGDECDGVQRISCREEPRLLLPIPRTDRLYHELRHAHDNKEATFDHLRDRFLVAGKTLQTRPKRIGMPIQALRATVGMFCDWFRFTLRMGWLTTDAIEVARPALEAVRRQAQKAANALETLRTRRLWRSLALPYGAAAVRNGLARADQRPRRNADPEHQVPRANSPPPDEPPF